METLEHLDADSEADAISDIQPVQNVTPNVRQTSVILAVTHMYRMRGRDVSLLVYTVQMKKLTKLLANRRLPGEHSLHRRAAARHAAINNREPDITEVTRLCISSAD